MSASGYSTVTFDELLTAWRLPPLAAAEDAEPAPADTSGDQAETIVWHDASKPARPDAEITVLLHLADDSMPIAMGWWDAECWCLCESGGEAPEGSVLAWAEVKGPNA